MTIISLLVMTGCSSNPSSKQINSMLKRVDAVERQVEALYNHDFSCLVDEYKALDTTVALTKDIRNEMELLQAYLQQFESQRVVINEATEYSRKQLSDLQSDVKQHLYDEKTTSKYIQDEETELRMMEAQIKYFQEKFDAQKEVVKHLRKE